MGSSHMPLTPVPKSPTPTSSLSVYEDAMHAHEYTCMHTQTDRQKGQTDDIQTDGQTDRWQTDILQID